MTDGPLEIRHGNARYALLRTSAVRPAPSEAAARRFVEQGLQEHGAAFARQLEALAEQLGGVGSGDAASRVIDGLVSGRLVTVVFDGASPLMSEPEHTDLSELGTGHRELPTGPSVPLPGSGPTPLPAQEYTWLSFDVVDEQGTPIELGHFRLALDGRGHDGPLDGSEKRYDQLRREATAELELEDIVLPPRPPDSGLT